MLIPDFKDQCNIEEGIINPAITEDMKDWVLFYQFKHGFLRAFNLYVEANPEIFSAFCSIAWEQIESGKKRLSSAHIIYKIRFETTIKEIPAGEFKLTSKFNALYSRCFAYYNPKYKSYFSYRRPETKLRRDDWQEIDFEEEIMQFETNSPIGQT